VKLRNFYSIPFNEQDMDGVQNNGSYMAASVNHPRQPCFRDWIQNGGERNSSETAVFRMRKVDDVTDREKKHMNAKSMNSGTKVEEGNSNETRTPK